MRNHDIHAFLKKSYFWRERVWGLKTRPKSWPTWRTFWVNLYLENLFSKSSGLAQAFKFWKHHFELWVGVMAWKCTHNLRVVLGRWAQYCPCEALEQEMGQKPKRGKMAELCQFKVGAKVIPRLGRNPIRERVEVTWYYLVNQRYGMSRKGANDC